MSDSGHKRPTVKPEPNLNTKPNSNKRKGTHDNSIASKRQRPSFQRPHISTTSTSNAFPNSELNVSRFVSARENEITALEKGMHDAKKWQMRRAFQDVPRDMRRRTASHNPKRVPGRLRQRTRREMKDDNTPVSRGKSGSGIGKGKVQWLRADGRKRAKRAKRERKKDGQMKKSDEELFPVTVTMATEPTADDEGKDTIMKDADEFSIKKKPRAKKATKLATPPTPPARFRRRQKHKSWLPTHLFHTKRAHLTPPSEPLWRFSIPLAPIMKSYRLTHRASTLRGAIAWDKSYVSTISLEGVENSIVGLMKALSFDIDGDEDPWSDSRRAQRWMAGSRSWEGWIHERVGSPSKKIAPITVMWCAREPAHEGSSSEEIRKVFIRVHPAGFFQVWNEIIKLSKVQKPSVTVEDLRFEVGSIEIRGPEATEALRSALSPANLADVATKSPEAIWDHISILTNIGTIPLDALLAFNVSDPRLHYPPRRKRPSPDNASPSKITQVLTQWPVDTTQSAPAIFSRAARLAASRSLPSQKSINRRQGVAPPGEYPSSRPTDPQIPVLLSASRSTSSWTVLLPWKCVSPVWRSILHHPLTSGGNPRFGGLQQIRQVAFETSSPWFPGDFPGTDAGWNWEMQERAKREKEWAKRPEGKRIEWGSVDLEMGRKGEVGFGWACDWERLLNGAVVTEGRDDPKTEPNTPPFRHIASEAMTDLLSSTNPTCLPSKPSLFTAKLTCLTRGVPNTCARIYRLPTNNPDLRAKWTSLVPTSKALSASKNAAAKRPEKLKADVPTHLRRRALAAGLLEPVVEDNGPPQPGQEGYPAVPDESDLIGFVTTGNFNLGEGKGTGVACLWAQRVLGVPVVEEKGQGKMRERYLCVVREAGQSVGRLARWEVV